MLMNKISRQNIQFMCLIIRIMAVIGWLGHTIYHAPIHPSTRYIQYAYIPYFGQATLPCVASVAAIYLSTIFLFSLVLCYFISIIISWWYTAHRPKPQHYYGAAVICFSQNTLPTTLTFTKTQNGFKLYACFSCHLL